MSIGDEDYRGIAVAVTVALRSLNQPFDFRLGEVFSGPQVFVGEPLRGDCSFYDGWRDQLEMRLRHMYQYPRLLNCPNNVSLSNRW